MKSNKTVAKHRRLAPISTSELACVIGGVENSAERTNGNDAERHPPDTSNERTNGSGMGDAQRHP